VAEVLVVTLARAVLVLLQIMVQVKVVLAAVVVLAVTAVAVVATMVVAEAVQEFTAKAQVAVVAVTLALVDTAAEVVLVAEVDKLLEQVVTLLQEQVAHTAVVAVELTTVSLNQVTHAQALADAEL
jgi:hypothetical protein